jgi:hypothetical protein
MIDRYGICTVGEMYKEDCGEWVLYEDAAARIAELETALQEIAAYGNMHDTVGWAVQAARAALKPANDKGE